MDIDVEGSFKDSMPQATVMQKRITKTSFGKDAKTRV
jgi:hypothetical protein